MTSRMPSIVRRKRRFPLVNVGLEKTQQTFN